MLAIIGNLHMTELLVIALVALMIFGRRLPEVAMRGAAQIVRLRRSVTKMWREAGLEEELRKVRRDIDREVHQVQRSLPSLTAPQDDEADHEDNQAEDDPQHEHWRAGIHSEISADEEPLARDDLHGEPAGEAIRQEGDVDDPPQEYGAPAPEMDEMDDTHETGELGDTQSSASESSETGSKESV